MKVVRVNDLEGVPFTGGVSFRPVLASDNLGFSICRTVLPVGGPNRWHYKNHLEACYCIKGKAILTNLETGITTMITKDVVYMLDKHDDHTLEILEDMVLISVFNPPLTGNETHDKNGNYKAPVSNLATEIYLAVERCANKYDAIEAVQSLLNGINILTTKLD